MSRVHPKGLLLHPRHWSSWLGFGLLRVLAFLPYRPLMSVGRSLGLLTHRLAKRRRNITEINLRLCFPEWDETTVQKMSKRYFASTGMGIMDFLVAWWWPDRKIDNLYEVEGIENLEAAFANGKGVICFTAHMACIEISGRLLTRYATTYPMYRPNENPVIQRIMLKNRERHVAQTIPREDVRLMLKTLRSNKGVWFAPDQNYGQKNSVFADFFGIPAATNTSTSRFAELTGAKVVPFVVLRRPQGGYRMVIEPALDNFPGEAEQDANRLNAIIERWVRMAPEQYNWMHRRFKNRPNHEPRFY
jgi:KDO2-lipid IV(A) lauroyltransferase